MKLLWIKRDVPDNYVDPTFLSQLKRNQNVVPYAFNTVLADASVLLVNIVLSVMFLLTFVSIYEYGVDPRIFVAGATTVDLIFGQKWLRRISSKARSTAIKSAFVTVVAILALTPVFRSLTESISSDSVWALCGWLLLLNVAVSSRSSPALAVNTALAATIVLASRLATSLDVFYFVLFNTQSFVALPGAYKWLKVTDSSGVWSAALVASISLCSCVLVTFVLGWLICGLWVVVQLAVLLGLPALFLSLQKHKDRISGPWDPAKPVLN